MYVHLTHVYVKLMSTFCGLQPVTKMNSSGALAPHRKVRVCVHVVHTNKIYD